MSAFLIRLTSSQSRLELPVQSPGLRVRWADERCEIYTATQEVPFRQTSKAVVVAEGGRNRPDDKYVDNWCLNYQAEVDLSDVDGEYSLARWSISDRRLSAARDPFGIGTLFFCSRGEEDLLLSNRLSCLRGLRGSSIDRSYVADFLVLNGASFDKTIWADIRAVPPATRLRWADGRVSLERYWIPNAIKPHLRLSPGDATEQFKSLFTSAVSRRMDSPEKTWCHLSGGLDSSSVTAIAATIAERERTARGLGGVITHTDSAIHKGEFPFAQAVAEKFRIPLRTIRDDWPWRDDGAPPPPTDQPYADYPLYSRARVAGALIREAGGTTLLTGSGADPLFIASMPISADLMWGGEFRAAITELHNWCLCRRESVWPNLYSRVLLPLVSPRIASLRNATKVEVPDFIMKQFAETTDLRSQMAALEAYDGTRGHYYQARVVKYILLSACGLYGWHRMDGISTRHPFVDKSLIEFVLQLPYQLRARSFWHKPLLRNSMKDILPDIVRTRRSKGPPALRITWAFRHERERLQRMLRQSVLADCGCIDPRRLLNRIDHWAHGGQGRDLAYVYTALSLETWLQRSLVGVNQSTV